MSPITFARVLALLFLLGTGCSRSAPSKGPQNSSPVALIDPCALVSKEQLAAIQGGEVKSVQPSRVDRGGIVTSQCYFTLPSAADSINLAITQRGNGANAQNPRDEWERSFHPKEGTLDAAGKEEEEGEKRGKGPEKINGVGDEAFWVDLRFGGVIYALKGNSYVRISVGGPGDQSAKKKNCAAILNI